MIGGVIAVVVVVRAVLQSAEPNVWALGIAALVATIALARPAALRPVHAAWMTFARALGWANTRILLGLVFYLVLAPLGIAMRLAGRDALRLKFDPDATTYAVPRRPRPGDHMRRLF
jgi:hypothetical protein